MKIFKEIILEQKNIERPKNALKHFSIIFSALFLLILSMEYFKNGRVNRYILTAAAFFILSGIFYRKMHEPLYLIWMTFGAIMNMLITRLALLVLFYLVMTPINILMKLSGKVLLDEKMDYTAKSYWKPYVKKEDKTRYLKQF